MPSCAITPKKIRIGSTFGRIARKPIRVDRNIADITTKMTPSAIVRLSICPATMSDVVPVSSTSVPVSFTGRSFGKCCAMYARTCASVASMLREPERRVRTRMLDFAKSGVTTFLNVLGLVLTILSTGSRFAGISQNGFGISGCTSSPASFTTRSPPDARLRPLSRSSR